MASAEFFRIHRDDPNLGLFVSRPLIHRGAQSVILSRRINGRDGQFNGVVAGTIRFSYFDELFGRLLLGDNDSITVLRRDGLVVMHTPFDPSFIGRDVSAVSARMLSEPSGSMSGTSTLDGISRLLAWHGSDRFFVVVVGRPWSLIYAMWTRQAIWIGSIMAILVAFAAAMTLFLAKEITGRAHAEASLKELAATDGLTGLSNRRKFDRELDIEWRRAMRGREPIALLLIDVDHFKLFNDCYGHQAGDKALQAVAACVAKFAKRPGDCAARYGGEEFALIIPGTRVGEALNIAEAVRQQASLCLSEPAAVTVSIGIATLPAERQSSPTVLVAMADRALYDAKRSGRNRCRTAPASAQRKPQGASQGAAA